MEAIFKPFFLEIKRQVENRGLYFRLVFLTSDNLLYTHAYPGFFFLSHFLPLSQTIFLLCSNRVQLFTFPYFFWLLVSGILRDSGNLQDLFIFLWRECLPPLPLYVSASDRRISSENPEHIECKLLNFYKLLQSEENSTSAWRILYFKADSKFRKKVIPEGNNCQSSYLILVISTCMCLIVFT